jgi:hypothetical membrane protein
MKKVSLSGLLLVLAGSWVLMGIITAEAYYPSGYTTTNSAISDLGSTVPPNVLIFQPSATIFNITMSAAGCAIISASILQYFNSRKLIFTIPFILFGIGLAGVGVFPGNVTPYHSMSSMLTFLSGGLSAVMSFKITTAPMSYVGMLFGFVALSTWFLAVLSPDFPIPQIGIGGAERWVAYPIMLWITGLGGYLMAKAEK